MVPRWRQVYRHRRPWRRERRHRQSIDLNLTGRRANVGGSSQYVGVYWDTEKKRWRATIEVDGIRYRCGRHLDEATAARAYDLRAVQLGVPERQNFQEAS